MHDSLSKTQKEKIEKFIAAALEFNKTHNIFSRKTKEEVYRKDVLDCVPLINNIEDHKSILDLGSGGGFPGIILSITKPKNMVSLVESNSKKCYFLRKIKHDLALENTNIINQTIEKNNTLGLFDVITTRAFASTKKTLKLTQNIAHSKTRYLLLKGKEKTINKELEDIDKKRHKYEIINLDMSFYERNIVLIELNE